MIVKHRTDGLCTVILGKVSGTNFQTCSGDGERSSLMDQENNLYCMHHTGVGGGWGKWQNAKRTWAK